VATNLQVNASTQQAVGAFNNLAAAIANTTRQFNALNSTMNAGNGSATRYAGSVTAINSAFNNLLSIASGALNAVRALGAGLQFVFSSVIKELDKLQGFNAIMSVSTKSTDDVAASYDFLRKTADRLGVQFDALTGNYAKLVAALPPGIEGLRTAEKVFMGVAMAARTMHASNQDTQLMFYAVTQIASKGVVSMEELRRQLGEKLPGVIQIAAKALNTIPEKLEEAIRKGIVSSEKFLPVFGSALIRTFADSSEKASLSVSAAIARLTNVWVDFVKHILDSGAGQAIVGIFDALREKLSDPYLIERFALLIKNLADRFTEFINKISADDLRNGFDTATAAIEMVVTVIGKLIEGITWIINNSAKAGAIIGGLAGAAVGALAGPIGAGVGLVGGAAAGAYAGSQLAPSASQLANRANTNAAAEEARSLRAREQEMLKLTQLIPLLQQFKGLNTLNGLDNLFKAENLNTKTLADLNRILSGGEFKTDAQRKQGVLDYAKYGVVVGPQNSQLSDVLLGKGNAKSKGQQSLDGSELRAYGLNSNVLKELSNYEKLLKSGKLTQDKYNEAVQDLIDKQPYMIEYLKSVKQHEEELAAVAKHSSGLQSEQYREVDGLRSTVAQMREEYTHLKLGEEGYRAREVAVLRATATDLEWQAANQGGNWALEEQARLLRERADLTQDNAMLATAQAVAEEWRRTAETIADSLADAFISGVGKGKSLFASLRDWVTNWLRQLVTVQLQNGITTILTGDSSRSMLSQAQLAASLYNTGGTAGGLLGYGAAAGNYGAVASGSAYGTAFGSQQSMMLAAQETGMVSQAGASSMSGWASSAGWIAAIVAGIWKANQDYDQGFNRKSAEEAQSSVLGLNGRYTTEGALANLLSKIGFSDRLSSLLSGSTAVAKIMGRAAPQVVAQGITGTLGNGDAYSTTYGDIKEKGGLLRSDKEYTAYGDLASDREAFGLKQIPDDIKRMLEDSSKALYQQVKEFGDVLGLPADALSKARVDFKIAFTENEEDNQKAITEIFDKYGLELIESWSDAISQLSQYGETAFQTINRVANALAGVNDVMEMLGTSALPASVQGGAAAVALTELFGGLDNLMSSAGSYFENFYTEGDKVALVSKNIAASLAEVGLAMPKTKAEFKSLVEAQTPLTESGRQAISVLMGVQEAFASIMPEGTALKSRLADLQKAIDDNIGKFQTPEEAKAYQYNKIARELQGDAGLFEGWTDLGTTLANASKDEVFQFAAQFVNLSEYSDDAKIAIVEAAGALADLKESAASTVDELAKRIAQFTSSLRSSDLSPLSYSDQLNASSALYSKTLLGVQAGDKSAEQNLIGNAQAYLKEARDYFGSSKAYADIFSQVTTQLDAVGAGSADPQVQAVRRTEAQIELAKTQVIELQNVVKAQADTNAALAAGNRALAEELAALNERVQRLLDNAQLAANAPT
jgi:tape measure domain-containing protein